MNESTSKKNITLLVDQFFSESYLSKSQGMVTTLRRYSFSTSVALAFLTTNSIIVCCVIDKYLPEHFRIVHLSTKLVLQPFLMHVNSSPERKRNHSKNI